MRRHFLSFIFYTVFFAKFSFAQQQPLLPVQDPCNPDNFKIAKVSAQDVIPTYASLSHEEVVEQLLNELDNQDPVRRLRAGMALKYFAEESDIVRLVEVLKIGNKLDKQIAIMETFSFIKDRRVGDALRFEKQRGEYEAKRFALRTLGSLQYDWPISILTNSLLEDDFDMARIAAASLGHIGSPQAIYALQNSASRSDKKLINIINWAIEVAKKRVDPTLIDREIPAGRWLKLHYKGTRYYFYHPTQRNQSANSKFLIKPRFLICVPDKNLDITELTEHCSKVGKKQVSAVLVPIFDTMRFPDYGDLNIRGERADWRMLEIIELLAEQLKLEQRELYLVGQGEGGSFVQRFTMQCPHRIARAAALSDNYSLPVAEGLFPKSVRVTPLAPDVRISLTRFLKADFAVFLDERLASYKDGKEFIEQLMTYAEKEGIRPRLAVRNKSGQSFLESGLDFLFAAN